MTPTEDLFDPGATRPSAPNLRQTLESFAGLLPAVDAPPGAPVLTLGAAAPPAPALAVARTTPGPISPSRGSAVAIFLAGLVLGAGALLVVLPRPAPEPAHAAPAPAPPAPAFAPLPETPAPSEPPAAAAAGHREEAPTGAAPAWRPDRADPVGAAPWTVTRKGGTSAIALAVNGGSKAGLRVVRTKRALVVKLPRSRLAAAPGSYAPEGFGRLQIRKVGRGTQVTVPHAAGAKAAAALRDGKLQLTVRR